jgi:hypothetical protein
MSMKGEWLVCAGTGTRDGRFFARLNYNFGPDGVWCDGWDDLILEVNRWGRRTPVLTYLEESLCDPETRALSWDEVAEFRRRLQP